MDSLKKLKDYQYKKYGKCLSCREPIPLKDCNIQCSNCGFNDTWGDINYLEDKE